MAKVIIPLSRSYQGHGGAFSSVELREPTYKDIYVDGLGEPQQWQPMKDGTPVLLTLPDIIDQYVQRLAVNPTAESLTELGTQDSLAVAGAVIDFFRGSPALTK